MGLVETPTHLLTGLSDEGPKPLEGAEKSDGKWAGSNPYPETRKKNEDKGHHINTRFCATLLRVCLPLRASSIAPLDCAR